MPSTEHDWAKLLAQLDALSPSEYHAYIASYEWAAKRHEFRATRFEACARFDACDGCGAVDYGDLDVHHATYARLGVEAMDDLRLVCRACHDLIHRLHRRYGGELERVTDLTLAYLREVN